MIMMFSFLVDTNLIQLDTDDMATNSNTYADNDDDHGIGELLTTMKTLPTYADDDSENRR